MYRSGLPLLLALLLSGASAFAQPMLVPVDPDRGPLALEFYRVEATSVDGAFGATVNLGFRNPGPRALEASFVFPLPRGCTVRAFAMEVEGQWLEGKMLEQAEAKKTYNGIVSRLKDPALLELLSSGLFQARVFPVAANGVQRLRLELVGTAERDGGLSHLQWPLKGARGFRAVTGDFTFTLKLTTTAPLKAVYSPSHELAVTRKGDHEALVSLEKTGRSFDSDLGIFFSVDDRELAFSVLTWKEAAEPGFFLLLGSPGAKDSADEEQGKRLLLVVDSSGSMEGKKLEHTKAAFAYALERLKPGDQFNVLRFASDVEPLFKELVPCTEANRAKALGFVKALEAAGGTAIHDALLATVKQAATGATVLFLTDGEPTVGETSPKRIAEDFKQANGGKNRLFPFGVGDDVNAVLLDRLALENRGRSTFLRPDKDIQETLQAFYDRVSHPVLRDLTLEVEGVGAYSLLPSPPPDLFRGDQLVVLGRYREAGQGTVTVTGLMGKQQRRYSLKVAFPAQAAQHAFVPTLWAQRQVALLLDRLRQDGENPALLKELVQLATKYGIVTPYTSYLVTVPGETMPPDSPEPPPHLVPMPGHRPPIPRLEIISEASVGTVAASPQMAQRAADHAAFKATTGASAVRSSQDLARLREADTVKAVEGTAPVSIGARAFELEGGAWVQREARGWKGPRVLLRTLGPAALALASSDPDLARVLALGQRVVFVLGKTLVEISPEAPDTDEAREQKLLGL